MTQTTTPPDQPRRPVRPGGTLLDDISLPDTVATSPDVLNAVMDVAIEIAREGREGRRIGTMLTVGDHEEVLRRSRCLILDPLAHHPAEVRCILRPETRETIKELAQLDGGFIVSDDGTVESACRYFESSLDEIELQLGLGTRHIAAASITRATTAIAVVISESSVVRVFHDGRLATEILPELWLLRRFIPHLHNPHLTERRDENIVVFGEQTHPYLTMTADQTEPSAEAARSRIGNDILDPAVKVSQAGRFDTMEALHALEDALDAPTPRRERTWLHRVLSTLNVLSDMLDAQTTRDLDTTSLLTEIRRDDPRLGPRVDRLRAEQADLRIAISSLRDQLAPDAAVPVDTADIRDRLAALARRLRAQRARESDLVYEAVNIDLGVGD